MRLPLILAGCLALAACDAPKPDPTPDTLPEPEVRSTQLRDAINEPINKAKAVAANQAAADAERREALEDAGG